MALTDAPDLPPPQPGAPPLARRNGELEMPPGVEWHKAPPSSAPATPSSARNRVEATVEAAETAPPSSARTAADTFGRAVGKSLNYGHLKRIQSDAPMASASLDNQLDSPRHNGTFLGVSGSMSFSTGPKGIEASAITPNIDAGTTGPNTGAAAAIEAAGKVAAQQAKPYINKLASKLGLRQPM
jgi:hypothetical protein